MARNRTVRQSVRQRLATKWAEQIVLGQALGEAHMSSDGTLLKEYAESRSEDAFAELVRGHLDFVYSTALCGVGGDEHLAKDVSQVVFMDLARKAGSLWHPAEISGSGTRSKGIS